MKLRQLEYFVAVAEESSFTRAAAALDISQPVLSRQIRILENDLGVDLFTRTSRKVVLTQSGERLLPDAYHILDRVAAAQSHVIGTVDGALRIGTYSTAGLAVFRQILAEYVDMYDEPRIEIAVMHWDDMGPAIRDGRVDAGFITTAAQHRFPDHDGLIMAKLKADPRVAVVRRDHTLAGRQQISIGDMTPYDLVQTAGLSAAHCAWWNVDPRPDGSSPRGPRSATTVAELLDIVSLTGDVAITTQSSAAIRDRTDIEFITLVDVEPAATFLAWSEAASPLTRRFIEIAKQVAHRPS